LEAWIVAAGLDWRQVELVRTYVNHTVQTGLASRDAIVHALVSYPRSTRLLWEYFGCKLDPLRPEAPRDRLASELPEIEQQFVASLDAVQLVADDRILRALMSAVAATVRPNFFAGADRGPPPHAATRSGVTATRAQALAVKFDCAHLPHLPRPQPGYEIYVHGPHMEGLHLRGSQVARGGIRLSDRPDDFRTEILDLMRTQMVKNA